MRFRSQTDVDCLALCANLNTYINYLLDKKGDPSNIERLTVRAAFFDRFGNSGEGL